MMFFLIPILIQSFNQNLIYLLLSLTMTELHNQKLELQIYYTAVGKLPKIGGCYFSNRQSTTINKRISQNQQKCVIDDNDLEKARKRLDFELKKNGYKKTINKPVKYAKCKTEGGDTDGPKQILGLEQTEQMIREQALKMDRKKSSSKKKHFPHYLIRLKQPQRLKVNIVQKDLEQRKDMASSSGPQEKMLQKLKIKMNEFDVQKLQNTKINSPKTIKTEEKESKTPSNLQSQRLKETTSYHRHSLLQKIKQRHGNTTQIPVSQLKASINQTVLFKRYREIQKESRDTRSRTQHFKEQLKQYL